MGVRWVRVNVGLGRVRRIRRRGRRGRIIVDRRIGMKDVIGCNR